MSLVLMLESAKLKLSQYFSLPPTHVFLPNADTRKKWRAWLKSPTLWLYVTHLALFGWTAKTVYNRLGQEGIAKLWNSAKGIAKSALANFASVVSRIPVITV